MCQCQRMADTEIYYTKDLALQLPKQSKKHSQNIYQ